MQRQRRQPDPDNRLVDLLTPDQLRIVKMTFMGASNQQIAYLTGRAERTIKNTLTNAFDATGAKNRTHLAVMLWWEIEGRFRK
jgi:DNA-binding NarL/FixJ family response regulator